MCEASNNSSDKDKDNNKEYVVRCPYCDMIIESTATEDIRTNPITMECPKCHKDIVNTYAYLEYYNLCKD